MVTGSRTGKTIINAKVGAACYMLSLLISFFTKGIFLHYLGTEFLGLTGTFSSILGFLNMAEFGISTAVNVVLYKPLFQEDKNEITQITSILGYLYRIVGFVILFSGIVVSLFLPIIFPNTSFSWFLIYWGYYISLISVLIGYFVNYRMVVLSADQRNYLVTGYYQIFYSVKVLLQLWIAIQFRNYYLFFIVEFLFGISYSFFLNKKIDRVYPWLSPDIQEGKQLISSYPSISIKVKQIFVHKIGGFVQNQSTPLFVYGFISLPMVAIYSNYTLIISSIRTLLTNVLGSTNASIGNLVAENRIVQIHAIYRQLFSLRIFCSSVIAGCINFLSSDFIKLWLGEEYCLSSFFVLLLSIHFFLFISREVTDQFLNAFGLVHDIWSPIAESMLFIISSFICGHYWGLEGILLAPIVSLVLVIYCWKPYFLFSQGFRLPISQYYSLFFSHILVSLACNIIVYYMFNEHLFSKDTIEINQSWTDFVFHGSCFFIVLCGLSFVSFSLFFSDFRVIIRRLKNSIIH